MRSNWNITIVRYQHIVEWGNHDVKFYTKQRNNPQNQITPIHTWEGLAHKTDLYRLCNVSLKQGWVMHVLLRQYPIKPAKVSQFTLYVSLHNPKRSTCFIIIGSRAPIQNITAMASLFQRQLQSKISGMYYLQSCNMIYSAVKTSQNIDNVEDTRCFPKSIFRR